MNKYSYQKQRGATLIISMIFLLILSIIGLAGMDVTGLEERMAGNMRDRNIAFQAAEAALRDGENYLESIVVLPTFDGTNGLYSLPADGTKNWEEVDWSDSTEVRDYSGSGFNELADNSSYIIEDLAAAAASDSLEVGVPADTTRFYRVTSRAEGLTDTTEVIIQTVYKR